MIPKEEKKSVFGSRREEEKRENFYLKSTVEKRIEDE